MVGTSWFTGLGTIGSRGRAEAPHARGACAGPSACGYGSVPLFSSPRPATHFAGTREANPPPGEPALPGAVHGRPGRRWGLFCEDDMSRRLRWSSPEGVHAGWNFCGGPLARRCHRIGARRVVLGQQAQVACAGYGIGAVGRAPVACRIHARVAKVEAGGHCSTSPSPGHPRPCPNTRARKPLAVTSTWHSLAWSPSWANAPSAARCVRDSDVGWQ